MVILLQIKTSGANNSDLVISSNDAQNVVGAAKNLNFMENCKVMIILD